MRGSELALLAEDTAAKAGMIKLGMFEGPGTLEGCRAVGDYRVRELQHSEEILRTQTKSLK